MTATAIERFCRQRVWLGARAGQTVSFHLSGTFMSYGVSTARKGTTHVSKRILAVILAVVAIVAGCGRNDGVAAAAVTPDRSQASPSGTYTAYVQEGPEENGVKPWVVLVRDQAGKEVFRDRSAYNPRNGVMISWLSTEPEQLWVYSGEVGVHKIAPGAKGGWTRAGVETENVPAEITGRWESSRS